MSAVMEQAVEQDLLDTFTSRGSKLLWHTDAMQSLQGGYGRPITCHIMPTDRCNMKCSFCSVQTRAGDVLPFATMLGFVDILLKYGLASVILSGGGNPVIYKEPGGTRNISHLIDELHDRGLQVGMITNGVPLKDFGGRKSYPSLPPASLDKLKWIRLSLAGWDHPEKTVHVPDVDPSKTTLGGSWVYHDTYTCPEEPRHGQVSTVADLLRFSNVPVSEVRTRKIAGRDRLPWIEEQIIEFVAKHHPRYIRLLTNCLEPEYTVERCEELRQVASRVNAAVGYKACFTQEKLPNPADSCLLWAFHPVLNADSYIYSCDSVVLNTDAREPGQHDFGTEWRLCHWSELEKFYTQPIQSSIANPKVQCPGCRFGTSNRILAGVLNGTVDITPPAEEPEHSAFV